MPAYHSQRGRNRPLYPNPATYEGVRWWVEPLDLEAVAAGLRALGATDLQPIGAADSKPTADLDQRTVGTAIRARDDAVGPVQPQVRPEIAADRARANEQLIARAGDEGVAVQLGRAEDRALDQLTIDQAGWTGRELSRTPVRTGMCRSGDEQQQQRQEHWSDLVDKARHPGRGGTKHRRPFARYGGFYLPESIIVMSIQVTCRSASLRSLAHTIQGVGPGVQLTRIPGPHHDHVSADPAQTTRSCCLRIVIE